MGVEDHHDDEKGAISNDNDDGVDFGDGCRIRMRWLTEIRVNRLIKKVT